jgi:DIS3-like exonuclease 2
VLLFILMCLQVVQIVHKVHHRQAVGTIKPMQEANSVWALFSPRDSRVPRVRVPHGLCPDNYQQLGEMLYLVQINDWTDVRFAVG